MHRRGPSRHDVGMLLSLVVARRVQSGEIDLVFRRWRRPSVRPGGRQLTQVGELDILAVDVVEPADIDDAQAHRAGYPDAAALLADLFRERAGGRARTAHPEPDSPVYRVRVGYRGPDPRVARREALLGPEELNGMLEDLRGIDARAGRAWAVSALRLIRDWPGRRAPELAELAGWHTAPWKANVRRLKELGLTESLPVGYRLSPRGEQVTAALGPP